MNKTAKLAGIFAIMALIGLCFWACEEPKNDPISNELPALTGTVSITGTAQAGKMLTANVSALGGSGTISFQWERDYSTVIGSDDSTYMIQDDDIGSVITVTVTRSENAGSITSDPTDYVIPSDLPALTGTVSIIGIAEVGETLTVDISNLGGDGWVDYYWKSHGHIVSYNDYYTVEEYDIGSTITVTVTRSENAGSITSTPTDIVRTPGLTFTLINNGTAYSVSKGTATGELVAIPAINNGLPVTEIADSGFIEYSNLTNVIIPNGITKIGNYAFFHCSKLTSIVIPSGITNIGNFAFSDCSSLTTVYFGGSSSTEWSAITMGSNNTQLTNVTRYYYSSTFQGTHDTHWRFVDGYPTVWNVLSFELINSDTAYSVSRGGSDYAEFIVIPSSYNSLPVIEIKSRGFYNCDFTDITIPNSVTKIGERAFSNCYQLTSIIIPDSVTSIGEEAFSNCSGLMSITIPDSVTSIGNHAFYDCSGLTEITIPDSVTSIGFGAFRGCEGLTSITVPFVGNTLEVTDRSYIGYIFGAVNGGDNNKLCVPSSLKTVIITGGSKIIYSAFRGCEGLSSITIPNSVTSIHTEAFTDCTGLTSITIPSSVTLIEGYAFLNTGIWNNTPNNSIVYADKWVIGYKGTINGDLTLNLDTVGIGTDAFSSCTGLTSITIPNSVTSIGLRAFRNCIGLKNITVDSTNTNYTSLNGVLYNKSMAQLIASPTGISGNFSIPNSVTSIDEYAFYYCTGLTSITIPNSVTSIGSNAFSECRSLTSVTIPDSVTSIGSVAFRFCHGLTSITIGNGVTSIGNSAFYGCTGLTNITIPSSVTSIGGEAFVGCTGLTSITLGTITSANFSVNTPFPGNLRDVYFAAGGGAGTYVTSNPGYYDAVWVKE